MGKFIFSLMIFVTVAPSVSSQKIDSLSISQKFVMDVEYSFHTGIDFYSHSFESAVEKLPTTFFIGAATYLTMNYDDKISSSLAAGKRSGIWYAANKYGNFKYIFPASVGIYFGGLLSGNDELRTIGRLLSESLIYSGAAVGVIKVITGRHRPYVGNGNLFFTPFNIANDFNSFPSGHSSTAFSVSTVLSEYFDNNYLRIVLYGFASLTAYERIRSNEHWMSDVLIGSAFGFAAGYYSVNSEKKSLTGANAVSQVRILPSLDGLIIVYRL
ncbi:MAG: phosphatase PAP2 family protein [Bacteroidetes bacterium]|nr:phosphatase PAP2 family protein [Bacteroidota bacterium]